MLASSDRSGRDAVPRRYASLVNAIYSTLKGESQGLVIPPRAQLDEAALVQRFGISWTPVREAIRRVVADDLVDLVPHQKARVSPILFESVRQVHA